MSIRTRFAPSPTGYLHLGGARTALFSWAFAKKNKGKFILRIEDTDGERSTQSAVNVILKGMEWLGLDFDEGPFFQSRRMQRYKQVIQNLLENNHAYHCYCSNAELDEMRESQKKRGEKPRYDGRWRPENILLNKLTPPEGKKSVIRFKNPDYGVVTWDDKIKGQISTNNAELDDLIIARSDGSPTYNFTVVVDDLDMEITHVIRGDDHINNTPRQINIFNALGAKIPEYAHLPMIHGQDGEKLSKRHGSISVLKYQELGYLSNALLNYLARLGWGYGDKELFSIDEFTNLFSFKGCSKSSSKFDIEKLRWVNSNYLKKTPVNEIIEDVKNRLDKRNIDLNTGPPVHLVCQLIIERVQTIEELANNCELFFFSSEDTINLANVINDPSYQKFSKTNKSLLKKALNEFIEHYPENPQEVTLDLHIRELIKKFGFKMPQFVIPLRLILLRSINTPSIAKVLMVLGKACVCERILKALNI